MNIEKRSRHKMHAERREVNRRPQTFMHGFRSAWPIAVACLLVCAFASSEPAQAEIERPPYKVYTYSYETTNEQFQWNYTINHYAGGGVEPMLDLQANLNYYANNDYTSQEVSSTFYWDHVILPLGDFPPGYDEGLIPYSFNIRIEGHIEGAGSFGNISASAGGGGYGTQGGQSISINETYAGQAMPNTAISAALGAKIGLSAGSYGGPAFRQASGQIIVDPYIYIDPTWQYASYFGVFQAPGPNDNGVWQQVNRDWMTPVPIPGAVWLLGSGLLGFVVLRKRRDTRQEG